MVIPDYAASVLQRLHEAGYEAYVVGGCVRDAMMGLTPHDFDVTTAATPEETEKVFCGFRVVETGIKHGTVTVLSDGNPVEITTFRVDGEYLDGRHPESVSFSKNLGDDLSRRDFTINGMAYSPESGLVDLFGGMEDIKRGVIRCIGDAKKRFSEDALRILRALRFASVLGFEIENDTAAAIRELYPTLGLISNERIFAELKRMLCGKNAENVLKSFPEVITSIIPELAGEVNYDQCSRYHDSTLYVHTARAVGAAENDAALRLAMLFHDCAKPLCRSTDENGEGHYYGHADKSAALCDTALKRLRCDNAARERVTNIIKYHDMPIELSSRFLRRQLSRHGCDGFKDIILAHIADDCAKKVSCRDRIPKYKEALQKALEITEQRPCLTLKDLAVSGTDLMTIMPPSPKMGEILRQLLNEVLEETLPNEKSALLKRAEEILKEIL